MNEKTHKIKFKWQRVRDKNESKYIVKIEIMFMSNSTGEVSLEERSKARIFVRKPRNVLDLQHDVLTCGHGPTSS